MDRQYSREFFQSFVDGLHKLCRDHLNFRQTVEVCGYVCLEIDGTKKERYVLSELVQNSGDVISESYCTKSFKTVKHQTNQNCEKTLSSERDGTTFRRDSGRIDASVKWTPSRGGDGGDVYSRSGTAKDSRVSKEPVAEPKQTRNTTVQSRTGSTPYVQTGSTPHVQPQRVIQVSTAVPTGMFASVPQGKVADTRGTATSAMKRPAISDIHIQSKRAKDASCSRAAASASSASFTNASDIPVSASDIPVSASDIPVSASADGGADGAPIVIKQEGVPFMVINPEGETLAPSTEELPDWENLVGEHGNENLLAIDQLQLNKHTSRKTRGHVKFFMEYLALRGITTPIHEQSPEELDDILGTFFWEVRKEDGQDYEPSYLKNIQSSLERHLRLNGYEHCITRDPLFEKSRARLKEKQTMLFRLGKGSMPNKTVYLTESDIDYLYSIEKLGDQNPDVLITTLWYLFSIYFASSLRTFKDHGDLLWRDVELKTGDDEQEFLLLRRAPFPMVNINHTLPLNRCPVSLYKTYRDRRGEYIDDMCPFYLCPNSKTGLEWFKPICAGQNRLNTMVRRMVDGSRLPMENKYTNTSIQMLVRTSMKQLRH